MSLPSKKFYLLFTQFGKLPPKLYKTLKTVLKNTSEKPQYKIKQYDNEFMANDAMLIHKMEHQRFLLNRKREEKVRARGRDEEESEQGGEVENEGKVAGQKQNIAGENKGEQGKQSILDPKSIEYLYEQRKQLLALTPAMPKLLHYHIPTLIRAPINPSLTYTGYFDGCSKFNPGPSGVGYYLNHNQSPILQACWPLGTKTNNQAQFLALLYLLTDAYINGIRQISIFGDSKLVVEISSGRMRASNINIVDYAEGVKKVLGLFGYWRMEFVERKYNTRADKLSNDGVKKKLEMERDRGLY